MSKSSRVLLLTGGQAHDFAASADAIADAIAPYGFDSQHAQDADALLALPGGAYQAAIVFIMGDRLNAEHARALRQFVRGGGGLLALHSSANSGLALDDWTALLGCKLARGGPMMEMNLSTANADHPIMHRITSFAVHDELYFLQAVAEHQPILQTWYAGAPVTCGLARSEGQGRVVYLAPGHFVATLRHASMSKMLARSLRWCTGEDWADKTIRCATIGYGGAFNMGKRHLESCKAARLTPTAVCDLDPARTAIARQELGQHIQTYNRVEDLLAHSDADLITLITPHNTHAPLALQVLGSGRHVVSEKPFTITVDEATAVIDAARAKGRMASVFHNRRWDGDFTQIRKVVRSGAIGEVFKIECFSGNYAAPRANWWRASKAISGGALYDWGAHFIDWIITLLPQKVQSVSGIFRKLRWHATDNEDHTEALIRFENGAVASLEQSALAAVEKARWRVLGTDGGLEIRKGWDKDGGIRLVTFRDGVRHDGIIPIIDGDGDAYYRNVADHLLLGEPLEVTAEHARKVIAIIQSAEKSSLAGGAPVALPFEQ